MYNATIKEPTIPVGCTVKRNQQVGTITAIEVRYFMRVDWGGGDPLGEYVEPDQVQQRDVIDVPAKIFPEGFTLGKKVRLRGWPESDGHIIGLISYQGDLVVDVLHDNGERMAYQVRALDLVPDPRDAVILAARRWQAEADPNETLTAGETALADALDALKA